MVIAKRRKSEGDIARISYYQSLSLKASGNPEDFHEAANRLKIAQSLKGKLEREQASASNRSEPESEESAFDLLVCHFFR